jgi:dienelactone hydrolase
MTRISILCFVLALHVSASTFAWTQALPSGVTERDAKVGSGDWAVDCTLTTPTGKGPFPAVLLVPGSGMTDRDMTVGKNKIFRDLAWGFAGRRIVVLRCEKRLAQHAEKFRSRSIMPSIRAEVIDDAVAGVQLLRSTPGVGSVYVMGHSQGATFAPRIANEAGGVAGIIIASGSTRKPGEMIQEQTAHVMAQPGATEEERAEAKKVSEAARELENLPADDKKFVLGMPVSYWRYFYEYDAGAEAARFKGRVLIIQNGRDYEVTEKDFSGWKKALAEKPNATLKSPGSVPDRGGDRGRWHGSGVPRPRRAPQSRCCPENFGS